MTLKSTYKESRGVFSTLDDSLAVTADSSVVGTTKDIGEEIPAYVSAFFGIMQTGTTDKADVEIAIVWTDDTNDWPPNDQGTTIFSWAAKNTGDDLTKTKSISLRPCGRYFRFVFTSNNATDSVTVTSKTNAIDVVKKTTNQYPN